MNQKLLKEQETEEDSSLFSSNEKNKEKKEALEIAEDAREKEYRQPSFGGKLFMGDFDPSLLFPFPIQSDEDQRIGDEYIQKLEVFLRENIDPDEIDRTFTIPEEVFKGLTEMGIFALKIPKEYGGLGFSQINYNRIVMKVASYCGATAVLISAHQSIGVPQPLLMYGTEEQKRKFFPRFREGAISAFALTEEDVGSDPAKLSSTATLSEDGTYYVLNGTKLWCTNGTIANLIVVMAQTKPKVVNGKEKKQISAFILDMDTPGIEITHRCEFMGLHGIYNGMLKFTNVKIPAENLLWKEGRGLAMALGTINVGRLTLPAASLGSAKQCLSIVRRWGKERVQWGLPIGEHEAGKAKVSYIAATTLAMEAITWLTSKWADEKKVDIRIEAAMAKYFCTEELWKITDMTMQMRGGRGYETSRSLKARGEVGFPVERAMRDCRINMILEGTSEIMKLFLAREAMDPHLQKAAPLLNRNTPISKKLKLGLNLLLDYATWIPKQWLSSHYTKKFTDIGNFSPQYSYIHKSALQLSLKLFLYMAKYQQKLEKRQMILGRLMDIGTDLFAMAATCSYAHFRMQQAGADKKSLEELANHFCTLAKNRIEKNFHSLENNYDREANKIGENVLKGDYKWLEEGIVWIGKKE